MGCTMNCRTLKRFRVFFWRAVINSWVFFFAKHVIFLNESLNFAWLMPTTQEMGVACVVLYQR